VAKPTPMTKEAIAAARSEVDFVIWRILSQFAGTLHCFPRLPRIYGSLWTIACAGLPTIGCCSPYLRSAAIDASWCQARQSGSSRVPAQTYIEVTNRRVLTRGPMSGEKS
jgi:hypothetical protein